MFLNLNAGHTSADLLRAVFEGVAMGHRLQLEQLKKAGLDYEEAALAGGAANSDLWCRIFADVTGLKTAVTEAKQVGALGDAVCAAVMLGSYPDIKSAAAAMVKTRRIYTPDKGYEEKYMKFKEAVNKWI